MKEKFMKFMYGRYGNDELNEFLFKLIFANLVISLFLKNSHGLSNIFYYLGLFLVGFIYYRMFSKDFNKRYKEKMLYLEFCSKLKNKNLKLKELKTYRFYKCPSCKQKVRIPKGRGKISIHCPKCGIDFIKKS